MNSRSTLSCGADVNRSPETNISAYPSTNMTKNEPQTSLPMLHFATFLQHLNFVARTFKTKK